jgi:hypothetical protein
MLSFLAVFALNVAVTASASAAPAWWIETSEGHEELLKGKEEFNKKGEVEKTFVLKSSALTIECKGLEFRKGFIEGPTVLAAESVELKECKVAKPAECTVEKGEIDTAKVTSTVSQVGSEAVFELKPSTGSVITEFTLTGTKCTLSGKLSVTGATKGVVLEASKLTKVKPLLFRGEGELKIGSEPGKVEGQGNYSATKGWSFH